MSEILSNLLGGEDSGRAASSSPGAQWRRWRGVSGCAQYLSRSWSWISVRGIKIPGAPCAGVSSGVRACGGATALLPFACARSLLGRRSARNILELAYSMRSGSSSSAPSDRQYAATATGAASPQTSHFIYGVSRVQCKADPTSEPFSASLYLTSGHAKATVALTAHQPCVRRPRRHSGLAAPLRSRFDAPPRLRTSTGGIGSRY